MLTVKKLNVLKRDSSKDDDKDKGSARSWLTSGPKGFQGLEGRRCRSMEEREEHYNLVRWVLLRPRRSPFKLSTTLEVSSFSAETLTGFARLPESVFSKEDLSMTEPLQASPTRPFSVLKLQSWELQNP